MIATCHRCQVQTDDPYQLVFVPDNDANRTYKRIVCPICFESVKDKLIDKQPDTDNPSTISVAQDDALGMFSLHPKTFNEIVILTYNDTDDNMAYCPFADESDHQRKRKRKHTPRGDE